MPPTQFSIGKVNIVQPYEFGQSGTDSPEPVLVTRPPAKIRTAVETTVSSAKRCRSIGTTPLARAERGQLNTALPDERERDVLRFLGADRDAGRLGAELLVPRLDGVGARR